MTEVGDSTAPATAGRRLTPLGFKNEEVYVWRYRSSLLFQAVHIYNFFWCMRAICFGVSERFVSVQRSGSEVDSSVTEVGDFTAPATAGWRLTPLGFKSKEVYVWRYLSSLRFQAVHIHNLFWCMQATCCGTCERFLLV